MFPLAELYVSPCGTLCFSFGKNLMLSYNLPQSVLKSTKFFNGARVYVQGQNLLTFTKFTGLDPEFSANIYRAQYPMSRQFTLGVELNF